jgi:hypothetical protein
MKDKCSCNDCNDNSRIEIANQFINMLDEDGQPMYSMDWIEEHILGIEKQKPEL